MKNMQVVKKAAQGIMMELESGRHHCQQKVSKSAWDRAMTTALDHTLRQLQEVDTGDMVDSEVVRREVELLKSNAEREALSAVNEQDRMGDAATIQVLLQAHFETISAVECLNAMSVDEAIEAATQILGKMLASASSAASYIVKPDGSLAPVEAFAPSKTGTPKRRNQNMNSSLLEASPIRAKIPVLSPAARPSPRRRALLGSSKKGVQVSFTPKKRKSPVKVKRAVRWRDDTEDGTLAEFEKTPQKFASSSPEESTTEITLPQVSELTTSLAQLRTQSPGSSPIPPPPESTLAMPAKSSRFQAGFLSKKNDDSPSSLMPPPRMTALSSSDSETSPLREIDPSRAANRRSLAANTDKPTVEICVDSASNSSAANSDAENQANPDRDDAMKIRDAVKRSSSFRRSNVNGSRTQRRRSPTAATALAGSPPNDSMFAAGHVRRMVMGKSDKENDWKAGVLSPRVQGVVSHSKGTGMGAARRTTMSGDVRSTPSTGDRGPMRMSSITSSHGHGSSAPRGSLMPNGKQVWR